MEKKEINQKLSALEGRDYASVILKVPKIERPEDLVVTLEKGISDYRIGEVVGASNVSSLDGCESLEGTRIIFESEEHFVSSKKVLKKTTLNPETNEDDDPLPPFLYVCYIFSYQLQDNDYIFVLSSPSPKLTQSLIEALSADFSVDFLQCDIQKLVSNLLENKDTGHNINLKSVNRSISDGNVTIRDEMNALNLLSSEYFMSQVSPLGVACKYLSCCLRYKRDRCLFSFYSDILGKVKIRFLKEAANIYLLANILNYLDINELIFISDKGNPWRKSNRIGVANNE